MALCVIPLASMTSIGDASPLSCRLGPYRLLETISMGAYGTATELSDDALSQSHVAPTRDADQPASWPPLPREVPPSSRCEAPPTHRWRFLGWRP